MCAKVDERQYKGDEKKQGDVARSMHEDRKQTGDEENRGPEGDDEEHSRSQESSVQSPTVGSFSSAFTLILLICSSCCSIQIDRHVHSLIFSIKTRHTMPSVSDSVCLCVQILGLVGGLERLKLESPSDTVTAEMQDIVKTHIEKTWLPQFLSTPEFAERQKHQPQVNVLVTRLQHTPE